MNNINIKDLLKKKWVITLVVFVLIILMVLYIRLSNKEKTPSINQTVYNQINISPPISQSVELQKAIEDQKKVDAEYSNWQEDINTNYPWLKKLPLYSDKYFVYFDINKKIFISKLYPKVTDNVNDMKTEIVRQLKVEKEITVESFKIQWSIIPR